MKNNRMRRLPYIRMSYLQIVEGENVAAKVVLNRKIHQSSLQTLHDLHWLPIHVRTDFKILMKVSQMYT